MEWFIKSENEESNELYGKRPEDRSIRELIESSVVLVDKHSGPTSHQITSWIGEIFTVDKTGHAGTLDPAVSGVLPVALGEATKAMPVLMGVRKEYVGTMHLHGDVTEDMLRAVIKDNFLGKITQIPPVKSAVSRKERERKIYVFDIIEMEDRNVLFRVDCEAGTYIRKLCHDVGKELRTGAHMTGLRRVRAGKFEEKDTYSMTEIRDAFETWKETKNEDMMRKVLIPTEYAIFHVKRVFVKDSAIDPVCHGAPLYAGGITRIQPGIERGETVAVYSLKEELVCLGISRMTSEEMFEAKKGTAVRTDRVFMERGTYPKD